jgi:3-oxoacyl-[acyl-carrier-protein] synthase III
VPAVYVWGAASIVDDDHAAADRRLDRYSRLALAAATAALRHAELSPSALDGERVAIVLGSTLGSYEANAQHRDLLAQEQPSPRVFAATLPSTPVGEIAIRLGARGPLLALAQGVGSDLAALDQARRLLLAGRADLVLAGVCDAIPEHLRERYTGAFSEGALMYVLARDERPRERGQVLGGGGAFGENAALRATAAAAKDAGLTAPPARHAGGLRGALGAGALLTVCAEDALGAATALVVR